MKYRTLRSIVRFIMKIIADIEIHEIDKLPQGNVIVAANHLGRLDTAVLLCVLDREDIIMPIAEKYKNHPLFGAIGRAANGIWLNRFEADYSALRQILARMEQGGLLVIAPEGTRSKTVGLVSANLGNYLIAWVVSMVCGFAVGLTAGLAVALIGWLSCIGWIFAWIITSIVNVWITAFYAHLFGQVGASTM